MEFNIYYQESPAQMEMNKPTEFIIDLTKDKKLFRKDIAFWYGMALRQNYNPKSKSPKPDWELINEAILGRWSFYGLNWIKELAWKIAKGKIK